MNGDAAGGELPELLDEDVQVLYKICKHAATSNDPPSKALFTSYDIVLEEEGIARRHDSVIFRWLSRLTKPRYGLRQNIDLVQELRDLLQAHNITVVDNTEPEVRAPADSRSRRRVSFDDARYEETWLSNHTHTIEHDAQTLEDLSGLPIHTRSAYQRSHARSLSNDRSAFVLHRRAAPQHVEVEEDFSPSQEELEDAAEAFLDTTAVRLARRYLGDWYSSTDRLLARRESDNIIAADHDYRMLLRQGWDTLYTAYVERVLEKQLAAKQEDDEDRAELFARLVLKQRVLTHWLGRARSSREIEGPVRRHILRFRYFERWKAFTLDTKHRTESILLRKYCQIWRVRVATSAQHDHEAEVHYDNRCAQQALNHWINVVRARQASRLEKTYTTRGVLQLWRSAVRNKQNMQRQARSFHRTRSLRIVLDIWTERQHIRQQQTDLAVECHRGHVLRKAVDSVMQHARLMPLLRQHQDFKRQQLQQRVLYHWFDLVQLEQKARRHNRDRLMKQALCCWNDTLRVHTLSQRIGDRLKAEMIYRLMLEERSRLCTRLVEGRLLDQCWQKLIARHRTMTMDQDQKLLLFEQDCRRRKLATVVHHLYLEMRKRDDAERAAVEFANARLLPRAWSHLRQASDHVQQLNKWSRDAAFFVVTKKTLARWWERTEDSRQEKRRLAYERVRHRVKVRLLGSTFADWRQKAANVVSMTTEAQRQQDMHFSRISRQIFVSWRQSKDELLDMQSAATQHDTHKLLRSALQTFRDRHTNIQTMQELAVEIRSEADIATMESVLKRLRFATFTLTRLDDNAQVFQKRSRERHMTQMLRHLAVTAAERRSRKEEEPESPSIRPASRAAPRSDSVARSARVPAAQSTATPAYLRTPSRSKRSRFRPLPTPAPMTPFTFTPARLTSTPMPAQAVGESDASVVVQDSTPQITPFARKLRAGGIATDVRPTSILRSRFGSSLAIATDKSVRFAGSSRFRRRRDDAGGA